VYHKYIGITNLIVQPSSQEYKFSPHDSNNPRERAPVIFSKGLTLKETAKKEEGKSIGIYIRKVWHSEGKCETECHRTSNKHLAI